MQLRLPLVSQIRKGYLVLVEYKSLSEFEPPQPCMTPKPEPDFPAINAAETEQGFKAVSVLECDTTIHLSTNADNKVLPAHCERFPVIRKTDKEYAELWLRLFHELPRYPKPKRARLAYYCYPPRSEFPARNYIYEQIYDPFYYSGQEGPPDPPALHPPRQISFELSEHSLVSTSTPPRSPVHEDQPFTPSKAVLIYQLEQDGLPLFSKTSPKSRPVQNENSPNQHASVIPSSPKWNNTVAGQRSRGSRISVRFSDPLLTVGKATAVPISRSGQSGKSILRNKQTKRTGSSLRFESDSSLSADLTSLYPIPNDLDDHGLTASPKPTEKQRLTECGQATELRLRPISASDSPSFLEIGNPNTNTSSSSFYNDASCFYDDASSTYRADVFNLEFENQLHDIGSHGQHTFIEPECETLRERPSAKS